MTRTMLPIALADGGRLDVRPIVPDDADALVSVHNGLTIESTRLRYFSPHPWLSPQEVQRFTTVDHHRREALVVLDGASIVAVARYDGMPDGVTAEVAFVVAEAWRKRGIATELLRRLAELARASGYRRLVADTLYENRTMASIFQQSGLAERHQIDQGVSHYVMDLGSQDDE